MSRGRITAINSPLRQLLTLVLLFIQQKQSLPIYLLASVNKEVFDLR